MRDPPWPTAPGALRNIRVWRTADVERWIAENRPEDADT